MKILVIGHSVEDHIHQNNKEKVKPGGIYYSVLGLTKIVAADDEIHLVTALQKSDEHLFFDAFDKTSKKNVSWVDRIPKVHLIIHDSEERTECYENISKNLDVDYSILNNFDGILINMITGFDITLEQLKEIRRNFSGMIYLDVHSLWRGITENKTRVFRQITNFNDWAPCADFIQANQLEVKTLSNREDEFDISSEILKFETKALIVTKGNKGASVYFKPSEKIEHIHVPTEKVKSVNKVGCGDIFGSVFFYTYLKTKNVAESLVTANRAAGKTAATNNLNEIKF
jgi:sugar/nucleoside kinase (ribokinase family)